MKYNKKLIEVALPLEAINVASAREKQPGIGAHPRGLHLWWARRPLTTARAVIFSQMVDDPSEYVDVLRSDAKLKRKAESALKARLKVWEEAKELSEKAKGTGLTVPEPGPMPTLNDMLTEIERQRLFDIIEELVKWENTTNKKVLQAARDEIWQSWRRTCAENADHPRAKEIFDRQVLPAFHDPFAGGGALPLEAQRLGLESYASDLNPVAVMINKAMIEIPPKFTGMSPINPEYQNKSENEKAANIWTGVQGLADDVRYYGKWMYDEADKLLGHLYPKIEITEGMVRKRNDLNKYVGKKLNVIAWLWARTVKSPNPAFANVDVPLVSTYMISTKLGKEAYIEPVIINGSNSTNSPYYFNVRVGKPSDVAKATNGTKVGRGGNFQCLMSGTPIPVTYIREQGITGNIGSRMMAIVVEGDRERIYLSPDDVSESLAASVIPTWKPEQEINYNPRDIRTQLYGLMTYGDLFTPRQLLSLTTFSDLIQKVHDQVIHDAKDLDSVYDDFTSYADALCVYLAFAIDRLVDYNSSITTWKPSGEQVMQTYKRQAIPMTWDFPESNVMGSSAICWLNAVKYTADNLESSGSVLGKKGLAIQCDAGNQPYSVDKVVSTDPPYYDNIGYADLSDFFYVWLRRSLRFIYPDIFATLAVPKVEELVATPYRHGSKEKAESFFLDGMTKAMHRLAEYTHPAFPVTIYYAFKQSESDGDDGTTNTGWDTFLAAVIEAGFAITGTWPMRTELSNRMISSGANVLASSIVIVCRKREANAKTITRRDFVNALKAELAPALIHLQEGNIAPVDLAQASIGPGMAVYTRYEKVLDTTGKAITVREALALINQILDEVLAEQEGDFDPDTRWALTWFEQTGFAEGDYGTAEQLSKSKNTSVDGMVEADILVSKGGKVRLLKPAELPADWDPTTDKRLTAWEMVHHLVRVLELGGEGAAAELIAKIGAKAEIARELCYRLYTMCERKKRAVEALSYNALVQSWPEIVRLSREVEKPPVVQTEIEF